MNSTKQKLLIISNTFPPNDGIGGRRWAKFAKYLNQRGHDIYVFTSDIESETKSPWSKDVEKLIYEDRVIRVKNSYPTILNQYPQNFIKKVYYRIALLFVRLNIKGNYYDRSTLWRNDLLLKIEKKIKLGYRTIVATGAPFRYIHHLLLLKKKHPDLKLIADFRDPWTNNKIAYDYDNLSDRRMKEELLFEKEILQKFDAIVCVDDSHIKYLKSIYPIGNYFTIPNGFDPEDFNPDKKKIKRNDNKIRFIYTGTLYTHSEYIFKEFIETLVQLKSSNPVFFDRLEFHFYGNKYEPFTKYFEIPELSMTVFHHGRVPLERIYQEINNADLCMLFLTNQLNYTKNTKFYEYMYMRKKVAVFSSVGFLEAYVVDNQIGFSLTPGNLIRGFENISMEFEENKLHVPKTYNVEKYSIPVILERYLSKILMNHLHE